MDAIRQRQIAEVLDENKTIGNLVFALEKDGLIWIQKILYHIHNSMQKYWIQQQAQLIHYLFY